MRSRLLTAILFIPMMGLLTDAYSQQPPLRVRKYELPRTPFIAGPLKITLIDFRGSFLKLSPGFIEAQVENTSTQFATFSPQRLSFVDKDNDQSDILGVGFGEHLLPAPVRTLAPGARMKQAYALTDKVHLPARLYYDEKLLAVIAE
ncbi:MAG TPA: hypothetical protein VNO70_12945 [Blastocatellia bacterium]|nr:hypothetical protein [Blastocatellia bacterium]